MKEDNQKSNCSCPSCQSEMTEENNFWVCSTCGVKFCLVETEHICPGCHSIEKTKKLEKVVGDEWFDVFAEVKKQEQRCPNCQPDTF